jgi:hypothetical protein
VLVVLRDDEQSASKDRFFVLPWRKLRAIVVRHYRRYLGKHAFIRPRAPESFHTALDLSRLVAYEGRWDVIGGRVTGKRR